MIYAIVDSPLYKLLMQGKRLNFPKGQVVAVFDEQAPIYLIKSGYVKRYLITKEGEKGIQVIYGPDDILPLTPIYKEVFKMDIYSGPEQYYYEAMTPVELYYIRQADLQEALVKDSAIYKDLFYLAGIRLNSYIHRLESMSLRVANRKVVHQLNYLAHIFGKKTTEGIKIMLPLTNQELGDILNLSRETVTREMVKLKTKGIIAVDNKNIVITDQERLKRIYS
ncbi:MAG TPA: Crp/Fnr family transcriptional regulator [Patescibacteria group bacterium]|nr:Crp/Fnr family transcriptional regulator [Patescibacteria group bacterium]